MPDILAIFNAGRVRRWHTHPVMADHDDRLDAHQGRVARLAMALFPGDHQLVEAALCHDDGEVATGDIPYLVKRAMPEVVRDWIAVEEESAADEMWWGLDHITCDKDRLILCDRLDCLMWVAHKEPHLLAQDDWIIARADVVDLGYKCGVGDAVKVVVMRALRGKRG